MTTTDADYETDLYAWTKAQADALRRRAAGELVNETELDFVNLAEEIESLGKSDQREILSRLDMLVLHLIKLAASRPGHRSARKWVDTVFEQRRELNGVIEDSPSLSDRPGKRLAESYSAMRKRALRLGFVDIPEECPWPIEDVLAEDFLP